MIPKDWDLYQQTLANCMSFIGLAIFIGVAAGALVAAAMIDHMKSKHIKLDTQTSISYGALAFSTTLILAYMSVIVYSFATVKPLGVFYTGLVSTVVGLLINGLYMLTRWKQIKKLLETLN